MDQRGERAQVEQVAILTTFVTPMTASQLVDLLVAPGRRTVVHHNLHSLALLTADRYLADCFSHADFAFIDGMPIVWYLRSRGMSVDVRHRTTVLDWLPIFLNRAADSGLRVCHLGGTATTAAISRSVLMTRHPGLLLETYPGFYNEAEESALVEQINDAAPDVLLVGMGMPRQEQWVARHRDRLDVPVVCTVGGAFSYFSDEQALPPRWLGPWGLEGAFRLLSDPRRLAHRYLMEPWVLVRPLMNDWLGRRTTG